MTRLKNYIGSFVVFFCSLLFSCKENVPVYETNLLVVGGGASGIMAGIQASRMGINTIVTEDTDWLGGMLTAAGVSAIDGDHHLPSGLWGEFRNRIYQYYGGPDKVSTGWVSNTLFEPHVGAGILLDMADEEKNLSLQFHYRFVQVTKEGNKVTGAYFEDLRDHTKIRIKAKIIVDATELGDVLANAGCQYAIGMDYNEMTGQRFPVDSAKSSIQDLTYVAILKDYGPGTNRTIKKPEGYDPDNYRCSCLETCLSDSAKLVECAKMLSYGKLPNNKYMINWPNHGNDYYVNVIEMSPKQREVALQPAKNFTLGFVYFIQTVLGYKNLGLADDEYKSSDLLPFIPYYRESRRVKGIVQFNINDILSPYGQPDRMLYKTAISVGDYPIDHHHDKNPNAPGVQFPPVPSFGLPLGCLVPQQIDGLIVAEKSISVSHIVNGTTRLQPVVMLLGQAAGALAAESIKNQQQPRQCDIRAVQRNLLKSGCWLLPFMDIKPSDPNFEILQEAGVSGILRGTGIPYKWANQTWLYPDSALTAEDFRVGVHQITENPLDLRGMGITGKYITLEKFSEAMDRLGETPKLTVAPDYSTGQNHPGFIIRHSWEKWHLPQEFDNNRLLTRREFAVVMHHLFIPFSRPIGFNGEYKKP